MLTPIYLDMRDILSQVWAKYKKKLKLYVQNIWQVVRWWHHQLNHLHIHIDLVKKCFMKICETSKCHNILIFKPIFIRFSLFCSQNFTLSSEIKLDQLRTSPLSNIDCLQGNTTYASSLVLVWRNFRYTAKSVPWVWLLRHNIVRANDLRSVVTERAIRDWSAQVLCAYA